MAASKQTVLCVVDEITQWAQDNDVSKRAVLELLDQLRTVDGNSSFRATITGLYDIAKNRIPGDP